MSKLIFVNRYFYPDISATSQMLSDLVFSLDDIKYELNIITSRQKYDDPTIVLDRFERHHGVNIHRVWTTRFGRHNLIGRAIDYLSFYFSAFFMLVKLTKKDDVIVAKTDPPLISVICFIVCQLKQAKQINWLQDLFPEVARELNIKIPKPMYKILLWMRNLSLKNASANVAIGELMAEKIIKNGVKKDKVFVINNWADSKKICPVKHEENNLRKEWGLQNKFVVAYSGNMGRSHNFNTILKAAEKLKSYDNVVFLFIGAGAQKESLQKIASDLNLNIIFKPYQPIEKLAFSISAGDIHLVTLKPELEGLIVPSKFYGILAAARIPFFIGAGNGEISRVLKQEKIGFTLTEDVDSLAEEILSLSKNNSLVKKMSQLAYEYFNTNNSLLVVNKEWTTLLSKI